MVSERIKQLREQKGYTQADLAKRLEAEGYAGLRDELGLDIKLAEDKA